MSEIENNTDTDSENEYIVDDMCTPMQLCEVVRNDAEQLLPAHSKEKYLMVYTKFSDWRESKQASISENVLIAYFEELAEILKPPSLWSKYSMLKSTIQLNDNLNIGEYTKLISFLKRQSDGYSPKKSRALTDDQIKQFLAEAPDKEYLVTKVVLVFGVMGALRVDEIISVQTEHVRDHSGLLLVNIPKTKTKKSKSFTIHGEYYNIVIQYTRLRPEKATTNRFFLNYRNGKCTSQPIGKNKLSLMAKQIAEFLKLPEPNLFTGHSFRRTSTTLLEINTGADLLSIKQHDARKSAPIAECYIEESYIEDTFHYKEKTTNLITSSSNLPSTSSNSDNLESKVKSEIEIVTESFSNDSSKFFPMDRFIGKVAVVSGSGSGIGAATAEELLKANLIVVGIDSDENKLRIVEQNLYTKGFSGRFIPRKCDVCDKNDVVKTFKFVNDDIGTIGILVNCAGVLLRTSLLEADDEIISKTLDTNVKGLLLCAQEATKYMIENSVEGHVININSINGHYIRNRPGISETMLYAASKHAVTVLTEGLRREMERRNVKIKFTSISPGHVVTELTASEGKRIPPDTRALQPINVAEACISVLNTSPTVLISELTIMGIFQEI